MAKIYGDLVCIPVHGTLEEWQTENPILLEGQEGIVITNDPIYYKKIGDGVTPWSNLPWKTGPQGAPGEDYVLTDTDKTDIANLVKMGAIGDIETALDSIIAIQESLIGGDSE